MILKRVKDYYIALWREVKIAKYLKFSAISFFIFFVLGILAAILSPASSNELFNIFSENFVFTNDLDFLGLFVFIFKNNLTIALVAFLSGIIFGLPTFLILAINAFVIGLVIQIASAEISFLLIIFSTIPHGIFEIPAIILSFSSGFLLGAKFFNYLFKTDTKYSNFLNILKFFAFFVVPLLFIAAVIESLLIISIK